MVRKLCKEDPLLLEQEASKTHLEDVHLGQLLALVDDGQDHAARVFLTHEEGVGGNDRGARIARIGEEDAVVAVDREARKVR